MKKFVPFDKFGKVCAPKGKELADTMQNNPEGKFAPDTPAPCSDTPCPPYWQRTCECRVTEDGLIDFKEEDGCGNTRWTRVPGKIVWEDTGNTECNTQINRFRKEQTNQCGDTRWINTDEYCCIPEWVNSNCGEAGACYNCDFSTLRVQQEDGCGHTRLIDTGQPVRWIESDARRCLDGNYQRAESNQCGDTRWTTIGPASWVDTGNTRCVGAIVEKEQENQCGTETRWVGTEVSAGWNDTDVVYCIGDVYSVEQENQCGETRSQPRGPVIWNNTGELRCVDGITERQQINQCGATRWLSTGTPCVGDLPPPSFAQIFGCHSRASNHDAAAGEALRFHPNGTWTVTKGMALNMPFANGVWSVDTPGDPGLYECRITGTRVHNEYHFSPECGENEHTEEAVDTGWMPLSSIVEVSVTCFASANISCNTESDESMTFTAVIREIAQPANTITGSGSICCDASAIAIG